MNRFLLKSQLEQHEGLRLKPYRCTEGKLTIGYGRNIEDVGISAEEAEYLLDNDIDRVESRLRRIEGYRQLSPVRQAVLGNMAFNLGMDGLLRFVRMWEAIKDQDFDRAAREMLDSRWAVQVGSRADELAAIMRTGEVEHP